MAAAGLALSFFATSLTFLICSHGILTGNHLQKQEHAHYHITYNILLLIVTFMAVIHKSFIHVSRLQIPCLGCIKSLNCEKKLCFKIGCHYFFQKLFKRCIAFLYFIRKEIKCCNVNITKYMSRSPGKYA